MWQNQVGDFFRAQSCIKLHIREEINQNILEEATGAFIIIYHDGGID